MSGEIGPVTYLVTHSDYAALERLAFTEDDILGVEVVSLPDRAAMAFRHSDSPAIERVASLRSVERMTPKFIPMICH